MAGLDQCLEVERGSGFRRDEELWTGIDAEPRGHRCPDEVAR